MRNYKSLTINSVFLLSLSLLIAACDKKSEGTPLCNPIILGKPFTAKIGETYCLPSEHWEVRFGPFLEDSRCNVPGLECFWEGEYVMAISIEDGKTKLDTFYADGDWRDTLYSAPYSIILNKVFPEVRNSMEPLDTSAYSFEIIVK